MNDYTLFDDFEYSGNWWLPGEPQDTVGGKVSYKDGQIMLELHRPFSIEGRSPSTFEGVDLPIILGQSHGTKITLYRARERVVNPGSSTYISADYLLTGKHFDSLDETTLTSLSVRYAHLEEWVGKRPFEVELEGGPSEQGLIAYSPPNPVEFELPEKGCQMRLTHSTGIGLGDFRSIRWKHSAWMDITPTASATVDWYKDLVFSVSQILGLLVGRTAAPIELLGHVPGEGERTEEGLVQSHVNLYINGFAPPSREQDELPWFFRVLVPLPDLASNVGQVFDSWFASADDLRPVHGLYLATLDNASMYLEFKFLALIQAIEAFHRRAMPPVKYLTDEQWAEHRDTLIEAIPDAISPDHKSSLENRLEFGNEYSLRKRLKELFAQVGDDVGSLIAEDSDNFILRVVEARNNLTHYDEYSPMEEGDLIALGDATQRLRRLLAALLWQKIGIDNAVIQNAVRRMDLDPHRA